MDTSSENFGEGDSFLISKEDEVDMFARYACSRLAAEDGAGP
jgi:hypothetical protein